MTCQHSTIDTDIAEMRVILERVDKAVNGNGQPGLVQRVGGLENWRAYILGALAIIAVLVTFGGGLLIAKLKGQ